MSTARSSSVRSLAPAAASTRNLTAVALLLALTSACAADAERSDVGDAELAPAESSDGAVRSDARTPAALPDAGPGTKRDGSLDATHPQREPDVGPEPSELDAELPSQDAEQGPDKPPGARDDGATPRDAKAEVERDGSLAADAAATDAAAAAPSDAAAHDAATDAAAPQLPLDELVPKLVERKYEGALCPPDSVDISAAGDHSALTAVFSEQLAADGSDTPVEKGCTLRLGFELPAGYALGNLRIYAQGYAGGTEGSADLTLSLSYRDQQAKQSASFMGLTDEYLVHERFDQVWSPSCGGSRRVELVLSVDGRVRGDHLLTVTALDVGFQYGDGAAWKRCDTDQVVQPPPSRLGASCGGPARHPCAEGLHCDLLDAVGPDELLEGVCIQRGARTQPAAKGERCGGVNDVACTSGLRCHHTSEARATLDTRGWCAPNGGRAEDRCAGFPALMCAEGFFCSKQSRNRCVASDGSVGARCEEGVPVCDAGLRCSAGVCERAPAAAGEPCGGAEEIGCTTMHVCDAETQRCVALPADGTLGGRCSSTVACGDGLRCVDRICAAP